MGLHTLLDDIVLWDLNLMHLYSISERADRGDPDPTLQKVDSGRRSARYLLEPRHNYKMG